MMEVMYNCDALPVMKKIRINITGITINLVGVIVSHKFL
jgi:hypothetical protein